MLAPAKDAGEMSQIIFNDRIDAALCGLFVLVVLSIIVYGIRSCLQAYRADRWTAQETTGTAADAALARGARAAAH